MHTRLSKLAALTVCALALTAPTFAQKAKVPGPVAADPANSKSHHHGSWWISKSNTYQEAYVNGYKAGWHFAIGHDTPLHMFGASTIVAGVDKFYSDFRNRVIVVDDAIMYVSQQLNGDSPEKLNAEILRLRAEAAKSSDED